MKFLRFLLLGAVPLSLVPVQAAPKKPVAAPKIAAPAWKLSDLPIALLPQVPVEFEFVGTQKDLLGLVQSVARGAASGAAKPISPNLNKRTQLLADAEVLATLRDIQFLRAQSFNFLQVEGKQSALRQQEAWAKLQSGAISQEEYQKLFTAPFPRLDVQEFYGKTFRAQHGRRQLFFRSGSTDTSQSGGTTLSLWLLDKPRSWALVTQGPTRAIVVRADSFPRLEAVGRLFRLAVSRN